MSIGSRNLKSSRTADETILCGSSQTAEAYLLKQLPVFAKYRIQALQQRLQRVRVHQLTAN